MSKVKAAKGLAFYLERTVTELTTTRATQAQKQAEMHAKSLLATKEAEMLDLEGEIENSLLELSANPEWASDKKLGSVKATITSQFKLRRELELVKEELNSMRETYDILFPQNNV